MSENKCPVCGKMMYMRQFLDTGWWSCSHEECCQVSPLHMPISSAKEYHTHADRLAARVEELESLVIEGREALNRVNAENAELRKWMTLLKLQMKENP